MTAVLFALVLLTPLLWGLERNHRRPTVPQPPPAGCSDTSRDRDTERLLADLRGAEQTSC
ncbi:hypothetical protein [Streptomyces sp. NBC_01803]|uniref:hypothetical protein n=1 Tax=Streptomyces sp. NBC_01803 TaxID=2975946 RepID=UPI002DD7D1FE|nr:hypothetical protein [Streptomyces sp. NBC_01803]WSA43382.1 hypothetical protein OIE51_03735 [Streptomyces sp. NBC_01803]